MTGLWRRPRASRGAAGAGDLSSPCPGPPGTALPHGRCRGGHWLRHCLSSLRHRGSDPPCMRCTLAPETRGGTRRAHPASGRQARPGRRRAPRRPAAPAPRRARAAAPGRIRGRRAAPRGSGAPGATRRPWPRRRAARRAALPETARRTRSSPGCPAARGPAAGAALRARQAVDCAGLLCHGDRATAVVFAPPQRLAARARTRTSEPAKVVVPGAVCE